MSSMIGGAFFAAVISAPACPPAPAAAPAPAPAPAVGGGKKKKKAKKAKKSHRKDKAKKKKKKEGAQAPAAAHAPAPAAAACAPPRPGCCPPKACLPGAGESQHPMMLIVGGFIGGQMGFDAMGSGGGSDCGLQAPQNRLFQCPGLF